jgi:phenylpyruvate tautomerase PptA (4-oxalocrotonate tautomerase family)
MPFIEVKTIRGVFSTEEKTRMIKDITGVFADMKSAEFAEGTWVVVNELDDGNWGEGGSVLNADHVPETSSS